MIYLSASIYILQYYKHREVLSLFSSRWNWGSPNPSPECAPPPCGAGHTRWRERGWERPNSNEGTYTVVLFICMYFVTTNIFFLRKERSLNVVFSLVASLLGKNFPYISMKSAGFSFPLQQTK